MLKADGFADDSVRLIKEIRKRNPKVGVGPDCEDGRHPVMLPRADVELHFPFEILFQNEI
jgi:hypothetical protein